ncbi:MAG: peptide chain release factor N(5)-glutamine methyltransferase [Oscillospiraceae bacterium]|nr:peptide chain release factor N(5)-glutamine methyltransferase [Oscillospiraceae bacterium]
MVKKYSELYRETRKALLPIDGPHQAGATARELLQLASGKSAAELLADGEKFADASVCNALEAYVQRMEKGEPLAYILGEWEFYGLKLFVTPDVLIPRDDTVAVTEIAIRQALFLDPNPRILDLCTGSGCIGLAIASRVKDAKVTLADLSREALAVAKKNVTLHHMTGRVSCVQADAMADPPSFLGQFDMIVSNPPYIDAKDMETLEISVRDFEPHMALSGGEDGLDFYRSITEKYRQNLKPGGYLCYEFGEDQGDSVCQILAANGFTVRQRVKDYNGTERAVIAQYCAEE